MPENVKGSYAVYHVSKKNHIKGKKNYGSGKAFHIFRPKVHDAEGNETWADLLIENGELIITVPQEFLDKAIYPIIIDPTFGEDSQGASYYGSFGAGGLDGIIGGIFTASESGDLESMSAFIADNASVPMGAPNWSQL